MAADQPWHAGRDRSGPAACLAQGSCVFLPDSHRLGSGEVREVELYSSPFEVGGGHYLYAIVHDVTERKQAIEALAESEARFSQFVRRKRDGDDRSGAGDWEVVDANLAAEEFYGYKREQMIGMPIDRINTLPAEEVALERQRALREERTRFNFVIGWRAVKSAMSRSIPRPWWWPASSCCSLSFTTSPCATRGGGTAREP